MNTTKKILLCLPLFLFFSFSYAQDSNKGTDAGDYSSINPIQRYEVSSKGTDAGDYSTINPIQRYEVSSKGTDAGDYSTINPIQRYEITKELGLWSSLRTMLGF